VAWEARETDDVMESNGNVGETHRFSHSISHRIHVCYIWYITFTINIPQMLAYIPYMDPMGTYIVGFSHSPISQKLFSLVVLSFNPSEKSWSSSQLG